MRFLLSILMSAFFALTLSTATLAQGTTISFGGIASNADAPVEVTADKLNVDQDSGNAIFSGNVVVGQGDLRMAANEIRVIYRDGGGISRLVATGGVTIVTPSEEVEAQRADYALDDDNIALAGDVLFVQGSTALAAETMRINLATNEAVLEGRVRTVLQPNGN